jgi:hypothetical protein
MKKCKQCKKEIVREDYKRRYDYERAVFCSRKCYHNNRPNLVCIGSIFNCLCCNKEKIRSRPHQKYCDQKCQLAYEYSNGTRDKFETPKAAQDAWRKKARDKFEKNPSISRGKRGYLVIHVPGRGQIYYHHWIWEQYHGKKPAGMHIHHIDGNRDNNDITNLQMLTNSEHLKLHWETDWKHKRKT